MRKPYCEKCGSRENLQDHHIVPKSEGGDDSFTNIMTLCTECHSKMHNNKVIGGPVKKQNKGLPPGFVNFQADMIRFPHWVNVRRSSSRYDKWKEGQTLVVKFHEEGKYKDSDGVYIPRKKWEWDEHPKLRRYYKASFDEEEQVLRVDFSQEYPKPKF